MLNLEERGDVTIVRLQHGKVNALDLELLLAIAEAMRGVDQARGVVITGSGSAFSAGVDLRRIVEGGPSYVPGSSFRSCRIASWPSSITAARWWPPLTVTPSPAGASSRPRATSG
jgi:enoyl-CoA hydratase